MKLKVAAAALNTTPVAWEENLRAITAAIGEAVRARVQVLCLPELCITGYGCEDLFLRGHVHESALARLMRIAALTAPAGAIGAVADNNGTDGESPSLIVTAGLPLVRAGALYNTVAVMSGGRVRGFYAKQNLASDGVHYEGRWFKPWPAGLVVDYRLPDGNIVPLGDVIFEGMQAGGQRERFTFGFEICEDAWVAGRPGINLARRAVDLILNPSASHFSFGKTRQRERFVVDGSRAFNCTYVYANLLGNEAGRIVYDGECLVASGGALVARGERFGYASSRLTCAVADFSNNRMARLRSFSHHGETGPLCPAGLVGECVESVTPPLAAGQAMPPPVSASLWNALSEGRSVLSGRGTPDVVRGLVERAAEFIAAETLALFDYARKTRARGFVISLSGGADSTLCAVLVHEMVRLGFEGGAADRERFAQVFPEAARATTPGEATRGLLTCIYQGAENSSAQTLEAANKLSACIGARFENVQVRDTVEKAEAFLAAYLGRPLNWDSDDITRQNIQARARALLPWTVANAENKLNLTTSNRSEAAVGYATMDGDTAGGLGPLGGVDKPTILLVLDLLVGRHPAIRIVRAKVPTAELRPAESEQSDEKDLMPYPVLDAIERAAILHGKSPREIVASGSGTEVQVNRFFRLFAQNQWKRERYAPSFHVDEENLDPRSFARFPILNGGFDE
jgi:NAD+ synthase (glutamine-hydrolysing)